MSFTLWTGSSVIVEHASGVALQFEPGKISVAPAKSTRTGTHSSVAAVLGTLALYSSEYLIVAKTRKLQGDLNGNKVYKLEDFELVNLRKNADSLLEKEYRSLVRMHLRNAPLYYSETYDLTNAAQRQRGGKTVFENVDPRFYWNFEHTKVLRQLATQNPVLAPFVTVAIFGVYHVSTCPVGNSTVEFGIITRRSRFRAGTRYFRRGLDENGNAANYNETEQLLFADGTVYSYVQTRGSVPVFWGEINRMQYRPVLRIGHEPLHAAAKHFDEQERIYGEQYLVNLVNQSGYEKAVKDAYEAVVKQLHDPKLHYYYFDFHHECSKMRWHRVYLLLERLNKDGFDKQGWFQLSPDGKVVDSQKGVARVNCMDCLDRTNVVQSCIAGFVLQLQLENAGVLSNGDKWDNYPPFQMLFRSVWADNADGVSFSYSGTGALKTDFTRTGNRTRQGALKDLRNSIARFYLNNLSDGPRQDGYNLFLGDFIPSEQKSNPFVDRRSVMVQSIPYFLAFGAIVFVLSVLYPSKNHSRTFNSIVSLVSLGIVVGSYQAIIKNGLQYVNWPKLLPTDYVDLMMRADNTSCVVDKALQTSSKQD